MISALLPLSLLLPERGLKLRHGDWIPTEEDVPADTEMGHYRCCGVPMSLLQKQSRVSREDRVLFASCVIFDSEPVSPKKTFVRAQND